MLDALQVRMKTRGRLLSPDKAALGFSSSTKESASRPKWPAAPSSLRCRRIPRGCRTGIAGSVPCRSRFLRGGRHGQSAVCSSYSLEVIANGGKLEKLPSPSNCRGCESPEEVSSHLCPSPTPRGTYSRRDQNLLRKSATPSYLDFKQRT